MYIIYKKSLRNINVALISRNIGGSVVLAEAAVHGVLPDPGQVPGDPRVDPWVSGSTAPVPPADNACNKPGSSLKREQRFSAHLICLFQYGCPTGSILTYRTRTKI